MSSRSFDLQAYLSERAQLLEEHLERCVPLEPGPAEVLREAMRYSLLGGGKRLRGILLLAACEVVGGVLEEALPAACAIEMIHAYSLIHDDLPCMDNDDFRRGKPTNHRVFGEANAVLAGDALLTDAFTLMAEKGQQSAHPERYLEAIFELARAAGSSGMVAGQAADMAAEGRRVDLATVEYIHHRKTGALLRAALRCGGILGGASPKELASLTRYGEAFGLAYQITDDLLDILGNAAVIGKKVHADTARGKATYPAVAGIEAARERVAIALQEAREAIALFGPRGEALAALADFVASRER